MPPKTKTVRQTASRGVKVAQLVDDDSVSSCSSTSVAESSHSDIPNNVGESVKKSAPKVRASNSNTNSTAADKRHQQQFCANGKLDINRCTIRSLKEAGIPHKIAQKVVNYRKRHKCFVHINELMRIPGIKGELFNILSKYTAVGSNTDMINSLLKKRKPAPSKSTLKAGRSKSKSVANPKPSKTPKRVVLHSDSASSISDSRPERRRRYGEQWPRGSASLSSVVTISPKPARSRSYHESGRTRYKTNSPSRSHRVRKYESKIPRSRSRSPYRSRRWRHERSRSPNRTYRRSPESHFEYREDSLTEKPQTRDVIDDRQKNAPLPEERSVIVSRRSVPSQEERGRNSPSQDDREVVLCTIL